MRLGDFNHALRCVDARSTPIRRVDDMLAERNNMRDALYAAHDMARMLRPDGGMGMVGYGLAELRDESDQVWDATLGRTVGRLKELQPFANLITDYGDLYYAGMGIALVNPAAPAQPTKVLGMSIGTGSTAAAKAGAGGTIVTFLVGQAFDSSFPSTSNLGAGLGVNMVYKTTYAAGTGTGSITEAVIQNTTIASAALVGATISRVVFTAIAKGAADSLAITWNHKNLGA
jgi:hypothetical protein